MRGNTQGVRVCGAENSLPLTGLHRSQDSFSTRPHSMLSTPASETEPEFGPHPCTNMHMNICTPVHGHSRIDTHTCTHTLPRALGRPGLLPTTPLALAGRSFRMRVCEGCLATGGSQISPPQGEKLVNDSQVKKIKLGTVGIIR